MDRDRGAASIFVLAVGLLLVTAGVGAAAIGVARFDRHRARTAADLGALAGAARVSEGPAIACAAAGRLVAVNGGVMTGCQVDGLEVVVRAQVWSHPWPSVTRTVTAAARAGPVWSPI